MVQLGRWRENITVDTSIFGSNILGSREIAGEPRPDVSTVGRAIEAIKAEPWSQVLVSSVSLIFIWWPGLASAKTLLTEIRALLLPARAPHRD